MFAAWAEGAGGVTGGMGAMAEAGCATEAGALIGSVAGGGMEGRFAGRVGSAPEDVVCGVEGEGLGAAVVGGAEAGVEEAPGGCVEW